MTILLIILGVIALGVLGFLAYLGCALLYVAWTWGR